jgi:hypothetical protein
MDRRTLRVERLWEGFAAERSDTDCRLPEGTTRREVLQRLGDLCERDAASDQRANAALAPESQQLIVHLLREGLRVGAHIDAHQGGIAVHEASGGGIVPLAAREADGEKSAFAGDATSCGLTRFSTHRVENKIGAAARRQLDYALGDVRGYVELGPRTRYGSAPR